MTLFGAIKWEIQLGALAHVAMNLRGRGNVFPRATFITCRGLPIFDKDITFSRFFGLMRVKLAKPIRCFLRLAKCRRNDVTNSRTLKRPKNQ